MGQLTRIGGTWVSSQLGPPLLFEHADPSAALARTRTTHAMARQSARRTTGSDAYLLKTNPWTTPLLLATMSRLAAIVIHPPTDAFQTCWCDVVLQA